MRGSMLVVGLLATAAAASTYKCEKGRLSGEALFEVEDITSLDACQELCTKLDGCGGLVYTDKHSCGLYGADTGKADTAKKGSVTRCVRSAKKEKAAHKPSTVKGYSCAADQKYTAGDELIVIDDVKNVDHDASCLDACTHIPDCAVVVHDAAAKTCSLRTGPIEAGQKVADRMVKAAKVTSCVRPGTAPKHTAAAVSAYPCTQKAAGAGEELLSLEGVAGVDDADHGCFVTCASIPQCQLVEFDTEAGTCTLRASGEVVRVAAASHAACPKPSKAAATTYTCRKGGYTGEQLLAFENIDSVATCEERCRSIKGCAAIALAADGTCTLYDGSASFDASQGSVKACAPRADKKEKPAAKKEKPAAVEYTCAEGKAFAGGLFTLGDIATLDDCQQRCTAFGDVCKGVNYDTVAQTCELVDGTATYAADASSDMVACAALKTEAPAKPTKKGKHHHEKKKAPEAQEKTVVEKVATKAAGVAAAIVEMEEQEKQHLAQLLDVSPFFHHHGRASFPKTARLATLSGIAHDMVCRQRCHVVPTCAHAAFNADANECTLLAHGAVKPDAASAHDVFTKVPVTVDGFDCTKGSYTGGNVATLHAVASIEDCTRACTANAACVISVYHPKDSRCVLKGFMTSPTEGVLEPSIACRSRSIETHEGYHCSAGVSFEGATIGLVNDVTVEGCAAQCAHMDVCRGFMVAEKSKGCHIVGEGTAIAAGRVGMQACYKHGGVDEAASRREARMLSFTNEDGHPVSYAIIKLGYKVPRLTADVFMSKSLRPAAHNASNEGGMLWTTTHVKVPAGSNPAEFSASAYHLLATELSKPDNIFMDKLNPTLAYLGLETLDQHHSEGRWSLVNEGYKWVPEKKTVVEMPITFEVRQDVDFTKDETRRTLLRALGDMLDKEPSKMTVDRVYGCANADGTNCTQIWTAAEPDTAGGAVRGAQSLSWKRGVWSTGDFLTFKLITVFEVDDKEETTTPPSGGDDTGEGDPAGGGQGGMNNAENGNGCGMGWAKNVDGANTCFMQIAGLKPNNWGWTNRIVQGDDFRRIPVLIGAEQCDGGHHRFDIAARYEGRTITIDLTPYGDSLQEAQVWIGTEYLPRTNNGRYTDAPGQFPISRDVNDDPVVVFEADGTSEYYFAVHVNICPGKKDECPDLHKGLKCEEADSELAVLFGLKDCGACNVTNVTVTPTMKPPMEDTFDAEGDLTSAGTGRQLLSVDDTRLVVPTLRRGVSMLESVIGSGRNRTCRMGWQDVSYGIMSDAWNVDGDHVVSDATLTECMEACTPEKRCYAFSRNRSLGVNDTGDCFLKRTVLPGAADEVSTEDMGTYVVACPETQTSCHWRYVDGYDMRAVTVKETTAITAAECYDMCELLDDCRAATYHKTQGTCYLSKSLEREGAPREDPHFASAVCYRMDTAVETVCEREHYCGVGPTVRCIPLGPLGNDDHRCSCNEGFRCVENCDEAMKPHRCVREASLETLHKEALGFVVNVDMAGLKVVEVISATFGHAGTPAPVAPGDEEVVVSSTLIDIPFTHRVVVTFDKMAKEGLLTKRGKRTHAEHLRDSLAKDLGMAAGQWKIAQICQVTPDGYVASCVDEAGADKPIAYPLLIKETPAESQQDAAAFCAAGMPAVQGMADINAMTLAADGAMMETRRYWTGATCAKNCGNARSWQWAGMSTGTVNWAEISAEGTQLKGGQQCAMYVYDTAAAQWVVQPAVCETRGVYPLCKATKEHEAEAKKACAARGECDVALHFDVEMTHTRAVSFVTTPDGVLRKYHPTLKLPAGAKVVNEDSELLGFVDAAGKTGAVAYPPVDRPQNSAVAALMSSVVYPTQALHRLISVRLPAVLDHLKIAREGSLAQACHTTVAHDSVVCDTVACTLQPPRVARHTSCDGSPPCLNNVCSGRGYATGFEGYCRCVCDEGFGGATCDACAEGHEGFPACTRVATPTPPATPVPTPAPAPHPTKPVAQVTQAPAHPADDNTEVLMIGVGVGVGSVLFLIALGVFIYMCFGKHDDDKAIDGVPTDTLLKYNDPFGETHLSNDVATLQKKPSEPMGIMWDDHTLLVGVVDGSPAALCGLDAFRNRRVARVNGQKVSTLKDIRNVVDGEQTVTLEFEPKNLTVALTLGETADRFREDIFLTRFAAAVAEGLDLAGFSEMDVDLQSALPTKEGIHVTVRLIGLTAQQLTSVVHMCVTPGHAIRSDPALPIVAATLEGGAAAKSTPLGLWVMCQWLPEAEDCSGFYLPIPGVVENGLPVWEHTPATHWLYSTPSGQWAIVDNKELIGSNDVDDYVLFSAAPHHGAQPGKVCDWNTASRDGACVVVGADEPRALEFAVGQRVIFPADLELEDDLVIRRNTTALVMGEEEGLVKICLLNNARDVLVVDADVLDSPDGPRVEVWEAGAWVSATVVKVNGTMLKVRFDNDLMEDIWLDRDQDAERIRQAAAGRFVIGDNVQVVTAAGGALRLGETGRIIATADMNQTAPYLVQGMYDASWYSGSVLTKAANMNDAFSPKVEVSTAGHQEVPGMNLRGKIGLSPRRRRPAAEDDKKAQ